MTVSSGFFNSVNHDRLYDAEQFSSIFDGVITDGVYLNYGDAFRVAAVPNQNSCVVVGIGRAWFDHTWTFNDAPLSFTMDPPNEMITRVDAIVIDVDRRKDVRANSIIYVKGSGSTPGEPPVLLKEELHRQYPICYIHRTPGSNAPVKQSEIEYLVGTDDCPAVTTVLETINLENLWLQLDSEFNIWWDGIRDLIDDDHPVLDLQNQIDELRKKLEATPTGLLERYILDMFKTGDFGLNIKSAKFQGGQSIGGRYKSETLAAPNNQLEGLLPNGEFASIYLRNISGYNSNYYRGVSVTRTNGDGVSNTNNLNNMAFSCNRDSRTQLFIKPDIFPATAAIVFYGWRDHIFDSSVESGKVAVDITVLLITMSSDNVLTYNKTLEYSTLYTTQADPYLGHPWYIKPTTAGNYILWLSADIGTRPEGHQGIGYPKQSWMFRVSSDGVSTNPTTTSNGPFMMEEDTYAPEDIDKDKDIFYPSSYGLAGKAVERMLNRYWCEIDETTLEVTRHGNDGTLYDSTGYPSPKWENTNFPVETFNLSEKNGVSITKRDAGTAVNSSLSTSRYGDYFLGASNSGTGLPEGTYLAIEDNGRLYGVAANGEQIAIGTDGGAAVLKSTVSSVPQIDINKVLSVAKGYLNANDKVIYVLADNGLSDTTARPNRTMITIERSN